MKVITAMKMRAKMKKLISKHKKMQKETMKQAPPKKTKKKQIGIIDYINS